MPKLPGINSIRTVHTFTSEDFPINSAKAMLFVSFLSTFVREITPTIGERYGEILDLNYPRDKETGKPRGFAFIKYDDQRSTILAVDNLNGIKVFSPS